MSPPWLGGTRRRAQQSAERERGWTVGALSHGAVSPQLLGLMQALALAAPPPAPRGAGEEQGWSRLGTRQVARSPVETFTSVTGDAWDVDTNPQGDHGLD